VIDVERTNQLRRRDQLQLSRTKHAERAWKKAIEVDALEKALRGQGGDVKDGATEFTETPNLRVARRGLAELSRFTERLGEELDKLDVNLNAPARVLLLQKASE
jgi:hypothetical protein